jgi:hypothetical protein
LVFRYLAEEKSRYSDEGMCWTTEKLGFDSQQRKEKLYLFKNVQKEPGTHLAVYKMGIRGRFPGDKAEGT